MSRYQRQSPDTLNQAKEYWETFLLHRWGILVVTVILAAIAVVVIALLPDFYTTSTTVLFDPQRLPERYVAPTVTADPAQKLSTLSQEVLSPGRLQQISQDLHLLVDPRKESQQEVIEDMRKAITVEMKQNADSEMSAFVISYTGQDPAVVAAVANRLAQSFIDWDLANRDQIAVSTTAFMTSQLQDAKQALDNEQAKLNDYKVKHQGELPEQMQSNMQALSLLHVALQSNSEALDRLQQEKTLLSAVPEADRSVSAVPTERDRLETERRTLAAQLASLRAQYTEQYPDVITTKQRLEAVTKQLGSSHAAGTASTSAEVRLQIIDRETARLQEEQKNLMQRIDKYQAEVDATPLREQEFEYLNRNYANAREEYEGLLDKKFHSEMASNLERQQKGSRFTVDAAQIPDKPVKPNRLLLFAMALPFCLLIPTGVAIASAEIRGTINTERSLRSLLPDQARVMGNIPLIETPSILRRRRRLAMLSILGSFTCCLAVGVFLWGGTAKHIRQARINHATSPSAKASLR